MCVFLLAIFDSFLVMMHIKLLLVNREEKLILGIKIAAAMVAFMIFIVVLILKLRECDSSSGSSASEGGGQVSIQLPAMNTGDSSVLASAV